jgi:hypothetical protein
LALLIIVNFIAFQAGWFAGVLGAATSHFWLGPVTVCGVFILHLYLHKNVAREITIGGIFIFCGFATDSLLTAFQVYTPAAHFLPSPFSPPWLMCMWLNLATIFNVSLKWLSKRYLLSAILGGLGGGLSYYGGGSLGALKFNAPVLTNIIITGMVWSALTPVLFLIVNILNKRFAQNDPEEKTG